MALIVAIVAAAWGGWHFVHPHVRVGGIRNVLLISIDTCRADHLGCYGYAPTTTPNVDALARDGVRFKSVITPVPMTLPAHCSMLTGTYPRTHGVRRNDGNRLSDASVTLAEVLRAAGYQTAAFIGGFPLASGFGLNQGFETYDDRFPTGKNGESPNQRTAEEVSRPAMAWLERHGDQPFFLFLHYYDPHFHYSPPPPFPATYDGEIAYVDVWIGKVMDQLRAQGLYDNTLVIVTGDHGEGLGDHGEAQHGFFIYQSTLRVPLVVRVPQGGVQGVQIDRDVSLVDIVPTVLGMIGLSAPEQVQGVDLSGCLVGTRRSEEQRPIYSESLWPELYGCAPLYGIIDGAWKYIQCPKPELYDLSRDGGEKVNLVDQQPQVARRLRDRLAESQKTMAAAASPESGASAAMDQDTVRRLQSLGYVGGNVVRGNAGSDGGQEDPKDFVAIFERCQLVSDLFETHRYQEAEKESLEIVSQCPKLALARLWLGQIALGESRPADAIRQLSAALSILAESKAAPTPSSRDAESYQALHCHQLLGRALVMDGRPEQAVVEFKNVVRIDPKSVEAHTDLAAALASCEKYDEAIGQYRKALALQPRSKAVCNSIAWILATCPEASVRNGAEAVELAGRVVRVSRRREPSFLDTLAAAYAETRQFPDAVATAEEAVELAKSANQQSLADRIQFRLELYRAGRSYHEAPRKASPAPAGS